MEYNMRKGPASFANRSFSIHHHRAKVVQHPLEQFVALPLSLSLVQNPPRTARLSATDVPRKTTTAIIPSVRNTSTNTRSRPSRVLPCPAVSRLYVRGLGPSLALRRPGRWQGVECAATDGGGRI